MSFVSYVLTGVPVGVCGREEWTKFQAALGPTYKLIVVSRDFFNAVVFEGPYNVERKLYLYHAQQHYSVITSMPAFVERIYYCDTCHVGYNNLGGHICATGCKCCRGQDNCLFVQWMQCPLCRRRFVSPGCFRNHMQSGICNVVQACPLCGKTHGNYKKHECGVVYCNICRSQQKEDHLCFMQPLTPKDTDIVPDSDEEEEEEEEGEHRPKRKTQAYIFYDFECMLVDNKHVPNLCVVQKVCQVCIEECHPQCSCKGEQVIFKGKGTLEEVGNWLFSGKHRGAICVAHNAQAYDAHLLLDYIHENGIKPKIIENGKKVMSMEVAGMHFIDSLNYFNTALAKLPKIFGLEELSKGYFPHLFSVPENQQYVGDMPPVHFYDPDGMHEDKREAFLQWYATQHHFDFQADLEKYCISDVDILRRCCGRFRKLFQEHTEGVDPFHKCFTIASACNRVYRTLFLKPNQVGIIPPQGYTHDNQSTLALCWLDWVARQHGVTMRHAYNGGEVRVEGFKVDGMDNNGVIYELHGCLWHGHEACYPRRSTVNPVNGITMQELRDKTHFKTDTLRRKGHTVIEKWECDFLREVKEDALLRAFYHTYLPYFPIDPRDSFLGGRVNAIILFMRHPNMRYVDFTR